MIDSFLRSTLSSLAEPNPGSELFIQVARWRLGCGDATGAAKWQLWSLVPPQQDELQQALVCYWIDLGELKTAAGILGPESNGWEGLNLLIQQGSLIDAQNLQQRLLVSPPPLELNFLLNLASAWQKAGCPSDALDLLEQLLLHYKRVNQIVLPPLANALAQLLEEHQRQEAAASWWRYSLLQDSNQIHPMMRLGRYAMAQNDLLVAFHYAHLVLERDPNHSWAPDLQKKALTALGARGSLALLANHSPPKSWLSRQSQWLMPLKKFTSEQILCDLIARSFVKFLPFEITKDYRSIALWADSDGLTLAQIILNRYNTSPNPSVIWLLASTDPLLQIYNLERLMPEHSTIQLKFWPSWDPNIHADVELLVFASSIKREKSPFDLNINTLYLRDI